MKILPVFFDLFIVFIEKMKNSTIFCYQSIMNIFRICSPGKIMNFRRFKMPGMLISFGLFYFSSFFLISMSNFLWILKISCTSNSIIFINRNFYIKISPYTLKFTGDIRICMPSLEIVLCQFRIPLAH